MTDENKTLLGLLNGLVRKEYYGEQDITEEYLKEQLYTHISNEEFDVIVAKARGTIKSMAGADMDAGQLDAFLTSQKRKREGAMTEDQAKVYARFWKNHRSRIHEALVARTLWSPSLVDLSWRIDIKTQSRQSDRLSCPTAILELQLKDPLHKEQDTEVVHVEMDEDGLNRMLGRLKGIEAQLQKYAS